MTRTILAVGLVGATITVMATSVMAAGVDGSGAIGTCPTTGKIGIKPPLVTSGTTPATVSVQSKGMKGGTCSGGSGDGANVISGKSKGSEMTPNNSCTGLLGTAHNTLTVTVKWKTLAGTPKLNPSTLTITSETGGASADGHGTFDVSGTVTAGSFNGDSVTAHVKADQTVGDLATLCGGKGIKKITFGVKPGSDGVLGSGTMTIL